MQTKQQSSIAPILFRGAEWTASGLAEAQLPELQTLCEQCADFYETILGLPSGPSEAHSIFVALPEKGASPTTINS